MVNLSVKQFADILAAKQSVPGGGGASALVGALSACCANMAGEFTLGKAKYAENEALVKVSMEKLQSLKDQLLNLIQADADAFQPLSKAYSIPKGEPGRAETLEKCLRDACAVPFDTLKLCCCAVDAMLNVANYGSTLMVSDVATAAAFAGAAIKGAAVNTKVNTCLMADKNYAGQIDSETDKLLLEYCKKAEKIYDYASKKAVKQIKEGEILVL